MTRGLPATLFDPGLQPERTGLAWRRTAISLAVGSLIALRMLPTLGGDWLLVPGAAGVALALAVLVAGERRYRRTLHHLAGDNPRPIGGGAILLGTSLCCILLAAGGLAVALLT